MALEQEATRQDILGNKFGEEYSETILTDFTLEARLKRFDPNLKLMFDQKSKRWKVLEWARDNSGWRILMSLEDDFGNPAPPGDWIFQHLLDMQREHDKKIKSGVDHWLGDLQEQAARFEEKQMNKFSEECQYKILNDAVFWKKAAAEFFNEPKSDVTCGYRKITPK